MAQAAMQSVEDRLYRLLQRLGIDQAHFASWLPQDWSGLVAKYPEAISSLTVVNSFNPRLVEPVAGSAARLSARWRSWKGVVTRSVICKWSAL